LSYLQVLEVAKDSTIVAFAWEPKGIRFAVIAADGGSNRTDLLLHTMGSKHNGFAPHLPRHPALTRHRGPPRAIAPSTHGRLPLHHHRRVSLLKNFERKSCNSLFWSPTGGILLVANLKGTSGQLEWIDVNVSLPNSNYEPMAR